MAAVYATEAELTAYADGSPYTLPSGEGGPPSPMEKLIERAQGDIDSILGDHDLNESGTAAGLKLDPSTLDYGEDRALTRATCAQALYRLEMGEEFFHRPVSDGEGFAAPPPMVGPMAMRELAGSGLLRNTTSVARRPSVPPWASFARNIEA